MTSIGHQPLVEVVVPRALVEVVDGTLVEIEVVVDGTLVEIEVVVDGTLVEVVVPRAQVEIVVVADGTLVEIVVVVGTLVEVPVVAVRPLVASTTDQDAIGKRGHHRAGAR